MIYKIFDERMPPTKSIDVHKDPEPKGQFCFGITHRTHGIGICTYIYYKKSAIPVGKYIIHGAYGSPLKKTFTVSEN